MLTAALLPLEPPQTLAGTLEFTCVLVAQSLQLPCLPASRGTLASFAALSTLGTRLRRLSLLAARRYALAGFGVTNLLLEPVQALAHTTRLFELLRKASRIGGSAAKRRSGSVQRPSELLLHLRLAFEPMRAAVRLAHLLGRPAHASGDLVTFEQRRRLPST